MTRKEFTQKVGGEKKLLASAIRFILASCIKEGRTITYSELMTQLREHHSARVSRRSLSMALYDIGLDDINVNCLTPRVAIVVNKRTGMPGKGFLLLDKVPSTLCRADWELMRDSVFHLGARTYGI